MEIEEALTTYLLSQSGLTALIDRRFYFDKAEDNQLPHIVAINVSNVFDGTHQGKSALEEPIYQFTVYAETKLAAKAIGRQLRTALSDYTGTISGLVVQTITMINELSSRYVSADGQQSFDVLDQEYQIKFDYV